jgi:predicted ester cyclase
LSVLFSRPFERLLLDARLYIRVRRIDEPAQRGGVCGRFRPEFHMPHELAAALQQAGRIRQRSAVKEPHVDVRGEDIDIAERRVAQTCNRTTVMQKLSDFVPALSHHLEPLLRDGSQFTCMLFHPRIDGGIPLDAAVESQQFRFHRLVN